MSTLKQHQVDNNDDNVDVESPEAASPTSPLCHPQAPSPRQVQWQLQQQKTPLLLLPQQQQQQQHIENIDKNNGGKKKWSLGPRTASSTEVGEEGTVGVRGDLPSQRPLSAHYIHSPQGNSNPGTLLNSNKYDDFGAYEQAGCPPRRSLSERIAVMPHFEKPLDTHSTEF